MLAKATSILRHPVVPKAYRNLLFYKIHFKSASISIIERFWTLREGTQGLGNLQKVERILFGSEQKCSGL